MDTSCSPTHRARQLRREQTEAERRLWMRLRDRQLKGFKFRRQFPIGPFIADFCCPGCRVVIEVDGEQHAEEAVSEADRRRSVLLADNGYMILRFWNHEVLADTDAVLHAILECLIRRART